LKNRKDVCILIQARLGSQRVPKKMLRTFDNGETLITRIMDTLSESTIPVYFSLYEQELKNHVAAYTWAKWGGFPPNFNVFSRSIESANSEGTPITEIYEWWDKLPYKYVILVNACLPFLKLATIENFVDEFCASDADGAFAVIEKQNYFWNADGEFLTPLTEDVMNTKTAGSISEAAHALYAGKLEDIGKGVWMGDFNKPGDIKLIPIHESEIFDIDYEWQWDMANKMVSYK
tara:strand:+ start:1236 stop:1934 length:699 start_codon:yes stop_codon:yes gene_type:complete